ncbi:MAG TPA: ChbG/HpnK family deacetylase [Planctomycetota bacterium]|nr:ChbG/HpnK family deacetylase [Planctomycetota bacterium]
MASLLITRADDFGSFPEANRAILACLDAGALRNVSVQAPTPWFASGAPALAATDACIGLHLSITCEWEQPRWGPVSDPSTVASLVDDDGMFFADPMVPFRRGLVLDEIMREAAAQLAAARAAGLDVRYVDEHMGVGWLHGPHGGPRLHERLRAWARSEGLLYHEDVAPMANDFMARVAPPRRPAEVAAALVGLPTGPWLMILHPAESTGVIAASRLRGGGAAGDVARDRALDAALLRDAGFVAALRTGAVRAATYVEAGGDTRR